MNLLEEAKYHYWAEKKFFELLRQVTEDQWVNNTPGFTKSLQEIYIHKFEVMFSWFTLLYVKDSTKINSNPLNIPEFEPLTVDRFIVEALALFDKLISYLEQNKEEQVSLSLEWRNSPYKVTNYGVIFNILNHLTYHRGQTAFLFKKIGFQVPETDYNPFMYDTNKST